MADDKDKATSSAPTPPVAPTPAKATTLGLGTPGAKPAPVAAPTFLDFAEADASKAKSALLGIDFGGLAKDPEKLLGLINFVNMILGLFKKKAAPTGTPPNRKPEPGDLIPVPPPPVKPEDPPPAKVRLISSFNARYYHISRKNKDISKGEFDAIIGRSSPLDDGDRVHLDVTPFDQFGREVAPGSPELEQLVRRWVDENGIAHQELRLRWLVQAAGKDGLPTFGGGGDAVGEVTNEYDDYGMTPVLKVPKGLKLSEERELGCFQLEFTPDGQARGIVSNILTSCRVKPWGE